MWRKHQLLQGRRIGTRIASVAQRSLLRGDSCYALGQAQLRIQHTVNCIADIPSIHIRNLSAPGVRGTGRWCASWLNHQTPSRHEPYNKAPACALQRDLSVAQPCCVQSAYRSALEQLLLRPPAQFSRAVLTQAGGPVRQATLASRCTCCSTLWTDVSTMSNTAHTVAGMPAPAKSGSPVPTPAGDSHAVTKRLQSELMAMMTSGDAGVSAFPDGDSLFSWVATIRGPAGTVYEGLSYKMSLKFPANYPFEAPLVCFDTPCFHPNVDNAGNICLDILKEHWSAAYSVRTILLSIQSLLGEPNNASPLNTYAAKLWDDQTEYHRVLHLKNKPAF